MATQWIRAEGRLVFRPVHNYHLRKNRPIDHTHLIVNADRGLSNYYRWWIDKTLHLPLQSPMLGEHVSVFNGKERIEPQYISFLESQHGAKVTYEYSPAVEQHWKFWVLPVRSRDLEDIRTKCGLSPNYHFHITIGRML